MKWYGLYWSPDGDAGAAAEGTQSAAGDGGGGTEGAQGAAGAAATEASKGGGAQGSASGAAGDGGAKGKEGAEAQPNYDPNKNSRAAYHYANNAESWNDLQQKVAAEQAKAGRAGGDPEWKLELARRDAIIAHKDVLTADDIGLFSGNTAADIAASAKGLADRIRAASAAAGKGGGETKPAEPKRVEPGDPGPDGKPVDEYGAAMANLRNAQKGGATFG